MEPIGPLWGPVHRAAAYKYQSVGMHRVDTVLGQSERSGRARNAFVNFRGHTMRTRLHWPQIAR